MNWFAVAFRLLRILPQINRLWTIGKPIFVDLRTIEPEAWPLFQRVRADLKRLDDLLSPIEQRFERVRPEAWPLINLLVETIDPGEPLTLDRTTFDIKWLQSSLNTLGYKLDVDGDYGEKTKEAVKKFQRAHPPLVVDGWAGVKTTASIYGESKAKFHRPT